MGDPTNIASIIPLTISVSAIVLLWVIKSPRLALAGVAVSLVAGQLIRLPLAGQGGGVLMSDIAISGFTIAASFVMLRQRKVARSLMILASLISLFMAWSLYALFITPLPLTQTEMIVAIAYWLRLANLLVLLPLLITLCQSEGFRLAAITWIKRAALVLAVLGIAQFFFISNLAFLVDRGWDPHSGRLVSTWLDPNYMGAFFVMVIPFFMQGVKQWRQGIGLALIVLALLLTQSRSSYLAALALVGMVPLIIITLRQHYSVAKLKVSFSALLVLMLTLIALVLVLFPDRIEGLLTQDATVVLRADALEGVWYNLVQPYGVLGVGYNAYQFYAADSGLISTFAIHSRAGADNSFITIWVTTGIIGLTLFIGMVSWIVLMLYMKWQKQPTLTPLVGVSALAALMVHALFVNSFLYAHLLILLALLVAVSWYDTPFRQTSAENI